MQDEVFPDRDHFGRIFFNQARMSARGIPQIAVVMGSCTAGGAYVPAMSDQTIMVREQATIFLGGPPLVEAATGEKISAEELGGAEVHCRISGVADYIADDDFAALERCRELVAHLPPAHSSIPRREVRTPLYSAQELSALLPVDYKQHYPMREVLGRIVDGSEFEEFKSEFGRTLICGFAHLHGFPVGILANDGILFSESAQKGAHFIELCCQRNIPLLFLQNIVGFMVGKEYEHGGIAKHGAKLVTAVACAEVPKITVVVGGSFGAGNYGMCGRAYNPRFLYMWPNAQISVMGPSQAASVLSSVRKIGSDGSPIDSEELARYSKEIEKAYEAQAQATYASARLWDDGIILPEHTRDILGLSLRACACADLRPTQFGVFRM
jgi:3-methylcrotonyl-CoA carboxylase beta subunit